MDFSARREQAINETKNKLRETLREDEVLIHLYRSINTKQGLDNWLLTVLPQEKDAKNTVKKQASKAWNEQGIGAKMLEEHWQLLEAAVKKKKIDFEAFAQTVAPNLCAVCGAETAAELISEAGSLEKLSRLTQRDCQNLGNESGVFGAKPKKSILESHELASSDRALRILCSRAVLAARIDAHNGEFKGDKLHQEVLYAQ
ncbi:MAG: hypothetical protein ACMXYD_01550 [Candidatus Woesearchaeota archaeon]